MANLQKHVEDVIQLVREHHGPLDKRSVILLIQALAYRISQDQIPQKIPQNDVL